MAKLSAVPYIVCFLSLSLLSPVLALTGYQKLVAAVSQANANAKSCKMAFGCLGKAVTLVLKEDVVLQGTLPPLTTNAHLIIKGACSRAANGNRCIIDSQFKFQVFSPFFVQGVQPVSLLQLDNLIFQKANGGVLADMWTNVVGTNLIFRNNINGVVRGVGRTALPSHLYTGCRFNYNNGTAIAFGESKFGLSLNETGIFVKNSIFYKNEGGAVQVAGSGRAVFESVTFDSNSALTSGGAVYADSTSILFRGVTFKNNIAMQGSGGAVFGQSYIYYPLSVIFSSSTFSNNAAPANKKSDSLFFQAYVPEGFTPTKVTVTFCDTPIPKESVFPPPPDGTVITGSGRSCYEK